MDQTQTAIDARRNWLGLLAVAPQGALADLCQSAALNPPFEWLRQPEVGTVMTRGRMGGVGASFNLGEITVTRASIRLATGEVGHGHVQGRDKQAVQWAAVVDALMQTAQAEGVRRAVIEPLFNQRAERRALRAAKAAATKVEFFTLVRGEE